MLVLGVDGNSHREIESGEHDSEVSGFTAKLTQQGFQFTDLGWLRRGITPIRSEDGLGTPSLRGLASPVGVVDEGGFIHEWIVLLPALVAAFHGAQLGRIAYLPQRAEHVLPSADMSKTDHTQHEFQRYHFAQLREALSRSLQKGN